jgi:hypothetical protein
MTIRLPKAFRIRNKAMFPSFDSWTLADSEARETLMNQLGVAALITFTLVGLFGGLWWNGYKEKLDEHIRKLKEAREKLGELSTDQFDKLVSALRPIKSRVGEDLSIEFVAPSFPTVTWQFANTLNYAFVMGLPPGNSTHEVVESAHDGVAIFADNETQNVREIADALRTTGVAPQVIVADFPKTPLVDSGITDVAEMHVKFRDIVKHEHLIISVGKLSSENAGSRADAVAQAAKREAEQVRESITRRDLDIRTLDVRSLAALKDIKYLIRSRPEDEPRRVALELEKLLGAGGLTVVANESKDEYFRNGIVVGRNSEANDQVMIWCIGLKGDLNNANVFAVAGFASEGTPKDTLEIRIGASERLQPPETNSSDPPKLLEVELPTLEPLVAGQSLRASIKVRNPGNVRSALRLYKAWVKLVPKDTLLESIVTDFRNPPIPESDPILVRPNGEYLFPIEQPDIVSAESIANIESSRKVIVLIGSLPYSQAGEGGEEHEVWFTYLYDPSTKKFVETHEYRGSR